MMDGIRRRLGKTAAGDSWSVDEGLKPEIENNAKLSGETEVSDAPIQASGQYAPDDPSTPDYYKSLVRTAIKNGGRHGDHTIPIPWLRMILAGLESKQIKPETMWYGIEAGEIGREPMPEIPPYEDFFQSSRDA